jgi:O-antigen/teichoic acid export membrane protein
MRLDIMMLQKMSSSKEVGYYSVAMNLAMIFPLITASLVTTLLPKLDEFLKNNSIRKYVYSILSKVKYVIVMLLIIEILAPFIIKIIFGS